MSTRYNRRSSDDDPIHFEGFCERSHRYPILFSGPDWYHDCCVCFYVSFVWSRTLCNAPTFSKVFFFSWRFLTFNRGIVQLLTLILNVAEPEGGFWDGVEAIGDNFEIIGGSICGLFLIVGVGSVLVYKPWRRRMDRRSLPVIQCPSSDEPTLE